MNNKEESENVVEENELDNLTQNEKEGLLHLEIEDKLKKEQRKKNKKLKKRERLKIKNQMRTGLAGNIVDDYFEAPDDTGWFSLSNIKKKEQLYEVVNFEDPIISIKEKR